MRMMYPVCDNSTKCQILDPLPVILAVQTTFLNLIERFGFSSTFYVTTIVRSRFCDQFDSSYILLIIFCFVSVLSTVRTAD